MGCEGFCLKQVGRRAGIVVGLLRLLRRICHIVEQTRGCLSGLGLFILRFAKSRCCGLYCCCPLP